MTARKKRPSCKRVNLLEVCAIPQPDAPAVVVRSAGGLIKLIRKLRFCNPSQEEAWVLCRDAHGRIVTVGLVHRGTSYYSIISLPDIFKYVITSNCEQFFFLHTHPTGAPDPSPEDALLTREMAAGSHHVGLKMIDHVIWGGGNRFYSFAAHDTRAKRGRRGKK